MLRNSTIHAVDEQIYLYSVFFSIGNEFWFAAKIHKIKRITKYATVLFLSVRSGPPHVA